MASAELTSVLQLLQSSFPADTASTAELRAGIDTLGMLFPPPADVECVKVEVGTIPAEWVRTPESSADRTILYLHGGGYMIGSPNSHRDLAQRVSRAANAQVLVIDYRLAPENPHPAAVEDSLAAYRWLLASKIPSKQIFIAGDSAGGGLTAATLIAIRDAGLPLPCGAVCISPWVDMEVIGERAEKNEAIDPLLKVAVLRRFADAYLQGADPRTPLAAPIYADLSNLPPLLIHVGSSEVLLDDSVRLAERARFAGVDVTLEVWDEMIHVWHAFAAILPEGQQAITRIGEFIRSKC